KAGKYELLADYKKYLIDLAFQTFVLKRALPSMNVKSFLMMADKSQITTVDGLNQKFKIVPDGKRTRIVVSSGTSEKDLGNHILAPKDLTDDIGLIIEKAKFDFGPSFSELVTRLSKLAASGELGDAARGSQCKACQFRVVESSTQRSGFNKCWSEVGIKPT